MQVAPYLTVAGFGGRARTTAGDNYAAVTDGPMIEVAAGTTRHAVCTMIRVRG